MTVELNYSDDWGDPYIDGETRRYSQLAFLLRSKTLLDIDCWSRVPGKPFMPAEICEVVKKELAALGRGQTAAISGDNGSGGTEAENVGEFAGQ
ncbi:MAG: hypothetical protein D6808_04745 [Candidatus Dadabacteria bacterium]|nr:MAG: hypothetical protein D6808_04745 [Candidatus Dadabacteria bacterium]